MVTRRHIFDLLLTNDQNFTNWNNRYKFVCIEVAKLLSLAEDDKKYNKSVIRECANLRRKWIECHRIRARFFKVHGKSLNKVVIEPSVGHPSVKKGEF